MYTVAEGLAEYTHSGSTEESSDRKGENLFNKFLSLKQIEFTLNFVI